MNKLEVSRRIVEILREADVRKPIKIKKNVFTISDNNGNSKNFSIKPQDKNVLYTIEDANIIIDAFVHVIEDALKSGENVTIHGFGRFCLNKRAERRVRSMKDPSKWVSVAERYVPKFEFGNEMRMAARVYDMKMKDDMDLYSEEGKMFYEEGSQEEDGAE